MQDFRNINNNTIPALALKAKEHTTKQPNLAGPKKGFIEARMNKDNFWNLMFASATFIGWAFTLFIKKNSPIIAFFSSWTTILLVPFLVRKFNKTTFTENKKFLSSSGEDITDRMPNTFVWPILLTIGVTALTGFILDSNTKYLSEAFSTFLILFVIFFSFASYFILINCPIAVLFSLDTWRHNRTGVDLSSQYVPPRRDPFSSSDYTSSGRSYLPCNIYHRSR